VIARARALGVTRFVMGGIEPTEWVKQREIEAQFPGQIFTAFGLHPWWVDQAFRDGAPERVTHALDELTKTLQSGYRPQAIGETGLDLGPRVDPASLPLQITAFRAQLALARKQGLPLVLHIVRAHEQALEILAEHGELRGLVHSFSGNSTVAERYRRLGLLISVGAGVTRNGFESLKKAVVRLPAESLVIESDSPDQLPEPASVWEVARAVAALMGRPESAAQQILEQSRINLERDFFYGSQSNPV
jgi:TatD DNase family protein